MEAISNWAGKVTESIEQVFFGKQKAIEYCLIAILCRGHVLLEDVPGVGKTILGRALALSMGGEFKHVQCTSDLLPSDVIGVSVYNQKTQEFVFKQGPVITNILLVDEINRATPRTQSALLEAMAEGQVSVEGKSIILPDPFFMLATQSPVESEGTFPLPEVQKDRFFLSINIGYPDKDSERMIIMNKKDEEPLSRIKPVADSKTLIELQKAVFEIHVEENIKDYILSIITQTRQDNRLYMGISPRGSLALYKGSQALAALRGRDYVIPEDIKEIAVPVLNKRILIKSEYSAKGLTAMGFIQDTLGSIEVPGYKSIV